MTSEAWPMQRGLRGQVAVWLGASLSALLILGCGPDGGQGSTGGSPPTGGAFGSGGVGTGGGGSGGSASGGSTATGGSSDGGGDGTATGSGGIAPGTGSGGVSSSGGVSNGGIGGGGAGGAKNGGAAGRTDVGEGGATAGGRGGAAMGGRGGKAGAPGAGGALGGGGAGAAANVTIWIAGDSTVADGSMPCPIGWGAAFASHFTSKVTVINRAIGGRSVQTWLHDVGATIGTDGECVLNSTTYQAAWTAMLTGMKTGDYLFIQFGINDGDSACPRHVGTALFKTDYGMMAQAARDRGAIPLFVTPVGMIACSGSKAVGSRATYAMATKQAGTQYNVPVIDLEQLSVNLYNSLGFCPLPGADTAATFQSGAIGNFFCEDHTHFEAAGAVQIGNLVAQALRDQGLGLAGYLK